MTDLEIINQVKAGDTEKFGLLVDKYQKMVFSTCIGYVHEKEDADDLTQEVFINAYQALPTFRGKSAFSTWLYRIAVNASLNHGRKKEPHGLLTRITSVFSRQGVNEQVIEVSDTDNPEESLIRQEEIEKLGRAIDSLPEKQRTAIILSKYEELSQREIAEIMDTTEGAVEALIQRAKANLAVVTSGKRKK